LFGGCIYDYWRILLIVEAYTQCVASLNGVVFTST
jgi:hypothetical protein